MRFPHQENLATIPDDLGANVLNLTPEQAVKFMEKKGFAVTWDWREQLAINNSQVFTVAKAMKMDVLKDIRGMLDKALKDGTDFREFKKNLKPLLQKKGWWGFKQISGERVELGTPRRLKIIYETNMQSAYMSGRYKAQIENKDNRPWLLYVNPTPEAPICKALVGQVRRADSSFWDTRYPPNHYRCKSRVRALTDAQAKARRTPPIKNDEPEAGFKGNPGIENWVPKKKDYPADIWKKGQPVEIPPTLPEGMKPPTFTPAKTVKEAKKFSKELGSIVSISGKTVKSPFGTDDLGMMNKVNKNILSMIEKGVTPPSKIIIKKHKNNQVGGWFDPRKPDSVFLNKTIVQVSDQEMSDFFKKTGVFSTDNIDHSLIHETAHLRHFKYANKEFKTINKTYKQGSAFSETEKKIINSSVSKYASSDPLEFIAETYTGLKDGIVYDEKIMKLFERFGGNKI